METDEERKARLKKMVATTQLKLAPETEDERRARLEYLSDNPIYKLIPDINCSISLGHTNFDYMFLGFSGSKFPRMKKNFFFFLMK